MDYGIREEVIKAFRVRDRETEGREEVIFEFSGEKTIVFCWLVFHLFFLKKFFHIKIGVESDGILFSFSCFTGFVRWAMVCLLVGIVGICHHQSTSKSLREGSLESVFQ
jgi:hypothetical protein